MAFRNECFIRYLEDAVGPDRVPAVVSALDEPASVSVRMNPYKAIPGIHEGQPVPWSEYGIMLETRPVFTLDPLFHAGCYYVQDSSSMFVGHVLRLLLGRWYSGMSGLRVLDLCASPGGKTTDAAASLRTLCGDGFFLVSNEVIRSRVPVLSGNVAVWGDPFVAVTSADPAEFGRMEGFFDIIIADVPCSGEGMFRKDKNAQEQWSPENVAKCAARQRRILSDVWPSLAENGLLVYSTCTFNRYENDGNVSWAAENLGAEILHPYAADGQDGVLATQCGYSLVPGFVKGEGQYCAVLRKVTGPERMEPAGRKNTKKKGILPSGLFSLPVREVSRGGLLKAVPESVADCEEFLAGKVRVVSSGCAAGVFKGSDFIPDADLALNIKLNADAFPRVDVDKDTALGFLHRDPVVLQDAPLGYVLVCHRGVPLGFVKNLGRRCNNLYPQERRIRMDIRPDR